MVYNFDDVAQQVLRRIAQADHILRAMQSAFPP